MIVARRTGRQFVFVLASGITDSYCSTPFLTYLGTFAAVDSLSRWRRVIPIAAEFRRIRFLAIPQCWNRIEWFWL
jgi:hypothetical protein